VRRLAALFALLLVAATLPADTGSAVLRVLPEYSTDIGRGSRFLTWTIAGNSVNILSELTWYGIHVAGVSATLELRPVRKLLLLGDVAAGWIVAGENRDSDYDGDDRTLEWSRSDNNGSGGLVWSASAAVGYQLGAGISPVTLAPLFGFSVAQQRFRMTDGYQSISDTSTGKSPPPVGPFPGLDSRYVARWLGSWVGLDLGWDISQAVHVSVLAAYHLARFYAWADWNLRSDFEHPRSFEQSALGWGATVEGGVDYLLASDLGLSGKIGYEWWEAGPGIDRTFNSNGSIGVTQLNRVSRRIFFASVGVVFRF
jgi:hypothetical protein